MIYILLINILTIIIGVIIYNKKNKKIAGLNQFNNFLREQNKELNNVIKTNEKKQKNIDMSNSNFTKALSYKALNSGKRYTSISKLNDGQEIAVFWEVPYLNDSGNIAKANLQREGEKMVFKEKWYAPVFK